MATPYTLLFSAPSTYLPSFEVLKIRELSEIWKGVTQGVDSTPDTNPLNYLQISLTSFTTDLSTFLLSCMVSTLNPSPNCPIFPTALVVITDYSLCMGLNFFDNKPRGLVLKSRHYSTWFYFRSKNFYLAVLAFFVLSYRDKQLNFQYIVEIAPIDSWWYQLPWNLCNPSSLLIFEVLSLILSRKYSLRKCLDMEIRRKVQCDGMGSSISFCTS